MIAIIGAVTVQKIKSRNPFDLKTLIASSSNLVNEHRSFFDVPHADKKIELRDSVNSSMSLYSLISTVITNPYDYFSVRNKVLQNTPYPGVQFHVPLGFLIGFLGVGKNFSDFFLLYGTAQFFLGLAACVCLGLSIPTDLQSQRYENILYGVIGYCLIVFCPGFNEVFKTNILLGQTNMVALFGLSAMILALQRGYSTVAGVLLSLAVFDKGFPIVFLLLAHTPREFVRLLAGLAVGIAGMVCIAYALVGNQILIDLLDWPLVVANSHYSIASHDPLALKSKYNYSIHAFTIFIRRTFLLHELWCWLWIAFAMVNLLIFIRLKKTALVLNAIFLLVLLVFAPFWLTQHLFFFYWLLSGYVFMQMRALYKCHPDWSRLQSTSFILIIIFPALLLTFWKVNLIYVQFGVLLVSFLQQRAYQSWLLEKIATLVILACPNVISLFWPHSADKQLLGMTIIFPICWLLVRRNWRTSHRMFTNGSWLLAPTVLRLQSKG